MEHPFSPAKRKEGGPSHRGGGGLASSDLALGDEVGDRGFYKGIRENEVANSSTKECTDSGDRNTLIMNTTDSDSENLEIMH